MTYIRRKADKQCFNGENYDHVISRMPCECTEMDYECDVGYFRKPGQMMCTFKESSLSDIAQKALVLERQNT